MRQAKQIIVLRKDLNKLRFEKSDGKHQGKQKPRTRTGGTKSLGFTKGSVEVRSKNQ